MDKYCVGVDVGGTTVKLGLFQTNGRLIFKWEFPTRKEDSGKYILEDVSVAVREVLRERQIHLELVVAVKGVHAYPVARQGFKGVGADKLRGVSGHEYLDVRPLLHQGRGQARRLIACNAAGDTQQHSFPL